MLALAAYTLFLTMGEMLDKPRRLFKLFPFAIALPYIATSTGWLMAEIGRFPWIVFGLMKMENGVSASVTPGMVLTSLLLFTVVYAALIVADVYLMFKFARVDGSKPAPNETEGVVFGAAAG